MTPGPACAGGLIRPGMTSPILHRAVLVRLQDTVYFCDVGFGGPSASCALPLKEKEPRTCLGRTFYIKKAHESWWTTVQHHPEEEDQEILLFSTARMEPVDFIPLSFYCSQEDSSYFRSQRMASLRTEEGSISISDMTFKETIGSESRETVLGSREELTDVLRNPFRHDPVDRKEKDRL